MKKMRICILILSVVFAFSACDNHNEDIDYTAVGKLAGQWWVKYEVETSPGVWSDIYEVGHLPLMTYNTASNSATEMFVDDQKAFWDYKTKVDVTQGSLNFGSTKELDNLSYESKLVITDGVVIFDAGRSKTGGITDSICFKVRFLDDDDNNVFRVSGHKRTGWDDDEY